MQLSKWPISRRRRCPCDHLVWQQGCGSVWPHCVNSQHLRHVLVLSAKEDSSAVHGTGDETMTSAEMGMPCEQRTLIRPTAFHSTSDKEHPLASSPLHGVLLDGHRATCGPESKTWGRWWQQENCTSEPSVSYVHDQGLFPALSSFLFSCFVIKVMFFKTTATQHKYVMHRQWSSFCWLLYFWDAFWRRRSKCVYVDTYTHRYVGVHMLGGRDIELLHPEHRPFQTCPGILFRFLWWYPHSAQVHQDHPPSLSTAQQHSTIRWGKVETKPTQRYSWL